MREVHKRDTNTGADHRSAGLNYHVQYLCDSLVQVSHVLCTYEGHVFDDMLGRLRLAGTGLAADHNALRASGGAHRAVCSVGNAVDVRSGTVSTRQINVPQVPLSQQQKSL